MITLSLGPEKESFFLNSIYQHHWKLGELPISTQKPKVCNFDSRFDLFRPKFIWSMSFSSIQQSMYVIHFMYLTLGDIRPNKAGKRTTPSYKISRSFHYWVEVYHGKDNWSWSRTCNWSSRQVNRQVWVFRMNWGLLSHYTTWSFFFSFSMI